MTKVRYLVFLYLLLMCLPANSNILMRNTFEMYEGDSLQEMGWSINTYGNGLAYIEREDTTQYQKQLHGEFSLQVYDPDDTSYAYAKHKFPWFDMIPNTPEYMVEF